MTKELTGEVYRELKRKYAMGIPLTEKERRLILNWEIMQILKDAGGEMSVGDMYKALGVELKGGE